jgi:hypothetical protein
MLLDQLEVVLHRLGVGAQHAACKDHCAQ